MCRSIILYLSVTILLSELTSVRGYSQEPVVNKVRFMFYNVENLFDVFDDTLTDDNDFLPDGVMRWNRSRYFRKINSIYKTIAAAGEWIPPEVISFCETENKSVVEDLIYSTYLSKYNYGIIYEDSPDSRGIDVCMIYRKDLIKIVKYYFWIPPGISKENYTSRKILYAKLSIDQDTIHLFVNHWPSRRGGVLRGEDMRMKISSGLKLKADSINMSSGGYAKIIIMGDFNSTPDDNELKLLTGTDRSGKCLVNLTECLSAKGAGSYRYAGTWEMIDQVIVSDYLLTAKRGYSTEMKDVIVFRPDFLLVKDPKYPGFTPNPTYRGYRYQGGTSDHLPVLLNINLINHHLQE